jgi:hypothetical protein
MWTSIGSFNKTVQTIRHYRRGKVAEGFSWVT